MKAENNWFGRLLLQEFRLFDKLRNRWFLIVFGTLFTSAFITFYNPLDLDGVVSRSLFGWSFSIRWAGLTGGLTLIFTQLILRPVFGVHSFKVYSFILWSSMEVGLMIVLAMVIWSHSSIPFFEELIDTASNTVLLAVPGYVLTCVFLSLFEKSTEAQVPASNEAADLRLVTLTDENGKGQLTLSIDDLIYLKADDNYVHVFYSQDQRIESKMIRNSLSKMIKDLSQKVFMRIHRSYIINIRNIHSIKRKQSRLEVTMNRLNQKPFPVSSTYRPVVEQELSNHIN